MEKNFNGMFGQTGWVCPKCGRVYSPFTHMCLYCKNNASEISCNSSNYASKPKFKTGDVVVLKRLKSIIADYGTTCEVKEAMLDDNEISWAYVVIPIKFPEEIVIAKEDEIELN